MERESLTVGRSADVRDEEPRPIREPVWLAVGRTVVIIHPQFPQIGSDHGARLNSS